MDKYDLIDTIENKQNKTQEDIVLLSMWRELFLISETLVDVSKWHISADEGINNIRKYMIEEDHKLDASIRKMEADKL